jgi:hypothetical protein
MKLVNLYGPDDDDAARPEPGPRDVLIKVAVCRERTMDLFKVTGVGLPIDGGLTAAI